jgi:hypothetical protein
LEYRGYNVDKGVKTLKKIIIFIAGAIFGLLTFTTAKAISEYLCSVVEYPVYINGVEYSNESLPLLNYEGNTYAPMRAFLESAGLAVVWDDETSSVMIVNASKAQTVSEHIPYTIETPDGIEASVDVENNRYIVFINTWKARYFNTAYSIHADMNGNYNLYKDNEIILGNLEKAGDKILGFDYDYYCNSILSTITG